MFISQSLHSQRKTYFGAEGSFTFPRLLHVNNEVISYEFEPNGKECSIILGRKISKNFRLETGATYHIYSEIFRIENSPYVNVGSFQTYSIPLRLMVSNDNLSKRTMLFASVGTVMVLGDGGTGSSGVLDCATNLKLSGEYESKEPFYALLEGRAGVQYKIVDELRLSLSVGFYYGFKRIRDYELVFSQEDLIIQSLKTYSKGEYWNIMMGFTYPLGRVRNLLREAYNSVI
jgi:hypothetical protein